MNKIITTDSKGKKVEIPEAEFQRAIIEYLREFSPDRVKIIAEMKNYDGLPKPVPAAVCFIVKNPEQVAHYTDLLPLPEEKE